MVIALVFDLIDTFRRIEMQVTANLAVIDDMRYLELDERLEFRIRLKADVIETSGIEEARRHLRRQCKRTRYLKDSAENLARKVRLAF